MREPPADLSEETLRSVLRREYALAVDELTFLPLGHDSLAAVYRVQAGNGSEYFLKVRHGPINVPGLQVPHYLHARGITEIIAPLESVTGQLWTDAGPYSLVLYPFVAGTTGKDGGLTSQQWIEYGAILRRVHDSPVPSDLARHMRRETFVPDGAELIRDVDAYLDGREVPDPVLGSSAAFWKERQDQIHLLVRRAESLGRRLAECALPLVLCHADIHTANVLVDAGGALWFVDWDETVIAPRERDLMFVLGRGISDDLVRPEDEALFFRGYGPVSADPLALAYYRCAWAVSDIGAYGAQVFLRPDLGQVDRRESAERLRRLFEPGEIGEARRAASLSSTPECGGTPEMPH